MVGVPATVSVMVTVPVGAIGLLPLTVTVRLRGVPWSTGLADDCTVTELPVPRTVTSRGPAVVADSYSAASLVVNVAVTWCVPTVSDGTASVACSFPVTDFGDPTGVPSTENCTVPLGPSGSPGRARWAVTSTGVPYVTVAVGVVRVMTVAVECCQAPASQPVDGRGFPFSLLAGQASPGDVAVALPAAPMAPVPS